MRMFRTILLASAAAAIGCVGAAEASLSINSSIGGAPNVTGVIKDNLDWLPVNAVNTAPPNPTGGISPQTGITIVFTPNAGAALGAVGAVFAAPFLSGNNGIGFGADNGVMNPPAGNQPNGADTTPYATAGSNTASGFPNSAVEILLPAPAKYFGLLWGSVDTYNTLSFYDGATLIGSITGSDVIANPNGNQGQDGTTYVNIVSTVAFDRIVATSSQFAFEFDNLAFAPMDPFKVPAPAALGLFGVGLIGLAWATRRRRGA